MIRIIAILLLLLSSNAALARDRFVQTCENAPLLSDMQKNLPDHVLDTSAEVKPKLLTKMARTTLPVMTILNRARSYSLICIVLAIGADGKVQDAAISYPKMALTEKEREQILKLEYAPAQQGGLAVPSLVSIDITVR